MGWAVGYDSQWSRDVGYGVPAICDFPTCEREIDRGLGYVCGGDVYGGEHGCGLFFCWDEHLEYDERDDKAIQLCPACRAGEKPYEPKPDTDEWVKWKLTHESWEQWRNENPELVTAMKAGLTTSE